MKKLILIFNVGILSTTPCFSILGSSTNDVLPQSSIENLATYIDNLAMDYYSGEHFIHNNSTSTDYIASLLQNTTNRLCRSLLHKSIKFKCYWNI